MQDLTPDERSTARDETLLTIAKLVGMSRDFRFPRHCREQYRARVLKLHPVYLKLGGHLSPEEILR